MSIRIMYLTKSVSGESIKEGVIRVKFSSDVRRIELHALPFINRKSKLPLLTETTLVLR